MKFGEYSHFAKLLDYPKKIVKTLKLKIGSNCFYTVTINFRDIFFLNTNKVFFTESSKFNDKQLN